MALQELVEEALVGLREELLAINNAIGAMEYLRRLRPTKGRPPKTSNDAVTISVPPSAIGNVERGPKRKSKFSAATRKRMATAQKKRWAQFKKAKVITMRKKKVA